LDNICEGCIKSLYPDNPRAWQYNKYNHWYDPPLCHGCVNFDGTLPVTHNINNVNISTIHKPIIKQHTVNSRWGGEGYRGGTKDSLSRKAEKLGGF
jgi:hypothetical protein